MLHQLNGIGYLLKSLLACQMTTMSCLHNTVMKTVSFYWEAVSPFVNKPIVWSYSLFSQMHIYTLE